MTDQEHYNTAEMLDWAASYVRSGNDEQAIAWLQDAAEQLGFTLRPIKDASAQARLAEIYDGMNTL